MTAVEGTRDSDGDGLRDFEDSDSDNDGILDEIECNTRNVSNVSTCPDTDSDGIADYLDTDTDGECVPAFCLAICRCSHADFYFWQEMELTTLSRASLTSTETVLVR